MTIRIPKNIINTTAQNKTIQIVAMTLCGFSDTDGARKNNISAKKKKNQHPMTAAESLLRSAASSARTESSAEISSAFEVALAQRNFS